MEKARMLINYDVEEKSVNMKVTKSRGGYQSNEDTGLQD